MTPKARADIHMNLPGLEKLDSMLIVGGLLTPQNFENLIAVHNYLTSLGAFYQLLGNAGLHGQ